MNMKILIGAAALALCAMTGSALAVNGKSYNGSYCHPYYGNQAGQFRHLANGIKNQSTSSRWITCPPIQDEVDTYNGTFDIRLHWSGSGSIFCTFLSLNYNGSTRQSQFASGGPGHISIPNVTRDDNPGSYALSCRLPAGATLNTFRVVER